MKENLSSSQTKTCSATKTSWKFEILLVESLDMIVSNKLTTKALIFHETQKLYFDRYMSQEVMCKLT